MGRIITRAQVLTDLVMETATDIETAIIDAAITKAEGSIRRYLFYDPVQASRTEFYPVIEMNRTNEGVWETDANDAFIRRLALAATEELQLQHIPIRSISSLRIDFDGRSGAKSGAFDADTEKTEGVDFWPRYDIVDSAGSSVCNDGILLSRGRWPDVSGSVKITYTAGYSAAELQGTDSLIDASPIWESTLAEAVARVHRAYSRRKRAVLGFGVGALSGERLGDYNYTADTRTLRDLIGASWDLMPETKMRLEDFVNKGFALAG